MHIIHTTTLSRQQIQDMRAIAALQRRRDGAALSCPVDGDEFWLLEDGGQTVSFFAVYKMDETLWECSAFTDPGKEGRGYFSLLLGEVLRVSEHSGEPDLCFAADNRCARSLDVLRHLEADFSHNEYMMACSLPAPAVRASSHARLRLSPHNLAAPLPEELSLTAWEVRPGSWRTSMPAGSCRLYVCGGRAYLYGLEIAPELRGMGYGTGFLIRIMELLQKNGCKELRLQVSGDNLPALALYKKTGFRITETLSYYLF